MVFYEHLGSAVVPGGVEIRLYKHDDDFSILLPRDELMSTRMRNSEDVLAVHTLARLTHRPAPRLLIGGYGMGYTLRACLEGTSPGTDAWWAVGWCVGITALCSQWALRLFGRARAV